jgi:hypothetical protein
VSQSKVLDLALRLWPEARDNGAVSAPTALDELLVSLGQPGAPGYDCGLQSTFACFAPDEDATLSLPTGELSSSDAEARFIGHVLVTRTLLAAGLHVDQRVITAMADAYAFSWGMRPGSRDLSPLALASTLWLIALDPLSLSDRPLSMSWSVPCFDDPERWETDYRLFSHYDIGERAMDWAVFSSGTPERREGCSVWTIVEPLIRLDADNRVRIALVAFSDASDVGAGVASATAMLERGRIATLLRGSLGLGARNTGPSLG